MYWEKSTNSAGENGQATKWELQDRDAAFNEATKVTLDGGQRSTTVIRPDNRVSQYFMPSLAVSKHANTTYTVSTDGTAEFGPAPLPPTDIDNDAETFIPPKTFERKVTVEIENTSTSTRTYYIQAKGWERRNYTNEGGL